MPIRVSRTGGLKLPSGNVPDYVGAYVVQEIIDRTQKGIDMDGRGFIPYRDPEARKKGGRQAGHVDLNWSGRMLGSMRHKINGNQVVIYFGAEDENTKAHGHHNGSKWLPQRKFFGLDPKIKQGIVERLKRWIIS